MRGLAQRRVLRGWSAPSLGPSSAHCGDLRAAELSPTSWPGLAARFLRADLVDDLEYRRSVPGLGNPFDRVPRGDGAFLEDCQIESRSAAREESQDHVGPPEPDAELVAGKAGLRHLQQGRADAQLRPDAEVRFREALRRQVLTERAPCQVRPLEFLPPERIMFTRVCVHGLRMASVDRGVRLTVSDEPEG